MDLDIRQNLNCKDAASCETINKILNSLILDCIEKMYRQKITLIRLYF